MSAAAHANVEPLRRPEAAIGESRDGGLFITAEQLARLDDDPAKARKAIRRLIMDLKDPRVVRGPTPKPPEVRIGKPADEKAIFDLVMQDLEENAQVAPIKPDHVIELIKRGTQRTGGIVAVIDGPDQKPVATQIMMIEKWWWSNAIHLVKIVDFVHPEHRQSKHAQHLIQFAKWAGDKFTTDMGYQVYMLSGVLATKRMDEKVRLYGRHVSQIGAYFLYPYPVAWD